MPDRSPDAASPWEPGVLFGLRAAWSDLRYTGGAAVRLHPVVGHRGVAGVRAATSRLRPVRGEGGVAAVVRAGRQAPDDDRVDGVPGGVGAAAELEADGGGVRRELGIGVPGGGVGGRLRSVASGPDGGHGDRGGRGGVSEGASLRDAGVPTGRRPAAFAARQRGAERQEPAGVLRDAASGRATGGRGAAGGGSAWCVRTCGGRT